MDRSIKSEQQHFHRTTDGGDFKRVTRSSAVTNISSKTKLLLKKLLLAIARHENEIELKRQYLASNENMEPYQAFQRIDRN